MTDIGLSSVEYKSEMLFAYQDDDGNILVNLYNGEVIEISNEKQGVVRILWNECCLGENDEVQTKEKLQPTKWNPKMVVPGS